MLGIDVDIPLEKGVTICSKPYKNYQQKFRQYIGFVDGVRNCETLLQKG